MEDKYTDEIARSLAEVRTACEERLLDRHTGAYHIFHCALVYHLRDGLGPEEAATKAFWKNILGHIEPYDEDEIAELEEM